MKGLFTSFNRTQDDKTRKPAGQPSKDAGLKKKLGAEECDTMATKCVSNIHQSGKFELLLLYLREDTLAEAKANTALRASIYKVFGLQYPSKRDHFEQVYDYLIHNRTKWIEKFGEKKDPIEHFEGSRLPPRPRLEDPVPAEVEAVQKLPEPRDIILSKDLKVAGASVVGGGHLGAEVFIGKNNQDAMMLTLNDDAAILAVCDGCSAAKHSDVGSKILVKCITNAFMRHGKSGSPEEIVGKVQDEVIAKLNAIIDTMVSEEDTRSDIIEDYFPATAIGAYITPKGGFFWGLGDGVFGYNIAGKNNISVVEAEEKDKPSYLAYHLLDEWPEDVTKKSLSVYETVDRVPDRFFVGSDGIKDLIALSGRHFPGADDRIPSLDQILLNERNFTNPTELPRILRRIQTLHVKPNVSEKTTGNIFKTVITTEVSIDSEGRFLPDDTTILAASLKEEFPGQFKF